MSICPLGISGGALQCSAFIPVQRRPESATLMFEKDWDQSLHCVASFVAFTWLERAYKEKTDREVRLT